MQNRIDGVWNIMATPFTADGALDLDSLRRLVNFQISAGAMGLTILGVLGEAAKLTLDERRQVRDTVIETTAGRIPVVVGTSDPDIGSTITLSKEAFSTGAAGVMITPTPFPAPTDPKVLAFYQELAAAFDGPIIVQDFPPVNQVQMSAELLAQLAEIVPNARHLKLEDPPLMQKIGAIRALTDRYQIFGGLGGMFFLEELGRGAAGTMTGFAFTEILIAVYQAFSGGDTTRAEQIFDRYLPLIRFENQPIINLSIRKYLLYRRGAMANPALRAPFAPIDDGTRAEADSMLRRVGISDPSAILTF